MPKSVNGTKICIRHQIVNTSVVSASHSIDVCECPAPPPQVVVSCPEGTFPKILRVVLNTNLCVSWDFQRLQQIRVLLYLFPMPTKFELNLINGSSANAQKLLRQSLLIEPGEFLSEFAHQI